LSFCLHQKDASKFKLVPDITEFLRIECRSEFLRIECRCKSFQGRSRRLFGFLEEASPRLSRDGCGHERGIILRQQIIHGWFQHEAYMLGVLARCGVITDIHNNLRQFSLQGGRGPSLFPGSIIDALAAASPTLLLVKAARLLRGGAEAAPPPDENQSHDDDQEYGTDHD